MERREAEASVEVVIKCSLRASRVFMCVFSSVDASFGPMTQSCWFRASLQSLSPFHGPVWVYHKSTITIPAIIPMKPRAMKQPRIRVRFFFREFRSSQVSL